MSVQPSEFQKSFGEMGPAEFVAGSIFGYREYLVYRRGGMYYSHDDATLFGQYRPWDSVELRATCAANPAGPPPDHLAPDENCTCGIYGYWGGGYFPTDSYHRDQFWFLVTAVVEASGRVLLGSKGFRAAYARIVGMSAVHQSDHGATFYYLRDNLIAKYGVPFYSNTDRLLMAHPPTPHDAFTSKYPRD